MLEELTKSFKAILYDRVVSPLSGAFILSWSFINWKVLTLLFMGDETTLARIANIEALSSMAWSWEGVFLYWLVYPLVSASLFIFAYPYPSKWAYSFAKDRSEELVKIKQEKEKKRLLTQEDADELRVQMERTKHEVAIMIKEKDVAIEALNNKLKSYEAAATPVSIADTGLEAKISGHQDEKRDEGLGSKGADSGENSAYDQEYRVIKSNRSYNFFSDFEKVINDVYLNNGHNLNPKEIQKYDIADIIWKSSDGKFDFTKKGQRMAHLFQSGQ